MVYVMQCVCARVLCEIDRLFRDNGLNWIELKGNKINELFVTMTCLNYLSSLIQYLDKSVLKYV